jgi:hypothetical protein
LLLSWCAGGRSAMVGSNEDHGRSRRPGVEDRDGQAQVGYSVTRQSRGRVTLCVICTVNEDTRSAGFLVEPQNQGRWFVDGLASKPLGRVSQFGPQNRQLWFGDLCFKITMTVSCIGPENQEGYDLLGAPQTRHGDEDD